MEKIKLAVYNLIRDDDENNLASNIFDGFIIFLIIINIILVIAETFNLPKAAVEVIDILETITVIIFTVEYLLRIWVSEYIYPKKTKLFARLRYILTFMALIDLFSILPFYLPFVFPFDMRVLRALRIIRLLRIFKVNRYTNALSAIISVLKKKSSQLLSSMFIVILLMIIASILMYNVEHEAQPEIFQNAFSGLWWAVATFTTVGYGDIFPITVFGKILSGAISLLGIGLVAVPTGIISAGFIEKIDQDKGDDHQKKFCSYCGEKID